MRLIILDDHKIFAQSLSMLLEENPNIELCKYVFNINCLLEEIEKDRYDICLIDINLKEDITGFNVIEMVKKIKSEQKIVILSSYDLPVYKERAFKLGALDYINKSIEIGDLLDRLVKVNLGNNKINFGEVIDKLTNRELEILNEIVKGDSKKEIAKKLYISERTLYNHIQSIYEKLGAKNAIEAYNIALSLGYIDPII